MAATAEAEDLSGGMPEESMVENINAPEEAAEVYPISKAAQAVLDNLETMFNKMDRDHNNNLDRGALHAL